MPLMTFFWLFCHFFSVYLLTKFDKCGIICPDFDKYGGVTMNRIIKLKAKRLGMTKKSYLEDGVAESAPIKDEGDTGDVGSEPKDSHIRTYSKFGYGKVGYRSTITSLDDDD